MNQQGFTLIEVLLSVAIIGLLVGMSLPVYETYARRNELDVTTQGAVSMFRRAATYARGVNENAAWSVRIETDKMTLYQGTDYANRDTATDETIVIPASITSSYTGDVQFAKLTALPSPTGSMTLTSTTNDTRTITLNAKGMVDF